MHYHPNPGTTKGYKKPSKGARATERSFIVISQHWQGSESGRAWREREHFLSRINAVQISMPEQVSGTCSDLTYWRIPISPGDSLTQWKVRVEKWGFAVHVPTTGRVFINSQGIASDPKRSERLYQMNKKELVRQWVDEMPLTGHLSECSEEYDLYRSPGTEPAHSPTRWAGIQCLLPKLVAIREQLDAIATLWEKEAFPVWITLEDLLAWQSRLEVDGECLRREFLRLLAMPDTRNSKIPQTLPPIGSLIPPSQPMPFNPAFNSEGRRE